MTLDTWNAVLPFSFKYGDKSSADLVPTWRRSEDVQPTDGGEIHRIAYVDPTTHLKVGVEFRTFTDFTALDWVMTFSNEGTVDTPILDSIEPLDWTMASASRDPCFFTWYGSNGNGDDFTPGERYFDPKKPTTFSSAEGLSSRITLPYFTTAEGNYDGAQVVKGPGGTSFAIGWTGNWSASLMHDPDAKITRIMAGMQKTHLLLHPGETIRTPRIVALNWTGKIVDAQNLWRKFVLKYFSPREVLACKSGLPVALITPGDEPMDARLARIKQIHETKIPLDLYWIDSGWFGTGDATVPKLRGSWTLNPALFPNGTKPLADALHMAGMDMMFWIEPETADPDNALLTAHPDWFFPAKAGQPSLLDLGNPAARKGITDVVSNLVTETGMTWLHQDFSQISETIWAAADAPDRVGMSEINYITGLYAFWDDLHAKHPDLILDNAARGGMRLDIEAVRRGTALVRSNGSGPKSEQRFAQELMPWVPLNGGDFFLQPQEAAPGSTAQLYAERSSYGPAWLINDPKLPFDDTLRQVVEEYHRVQPFFLGDFYPLSANSPDDTTGVAFQFHRPDLKAGVVLAFRRDKCPFTAVQPILQGLDPAASYDVEVRHGLAPGTVQRMTGAELASIQIPLPEKPDSAIVFYQQK